MNYNYKPIQYYYSSGHSVVGGYSEGSGFSLIDLPASVKTGSSVNNFAHKIAHGQDAGSNYYRADFKIKRTSRVHIDSYLSSGVKKYVCDNVGWYPHFEVPPSGLTWVDDRALQLFKNRLESAFSHIKALVPLAESRELQGTVKRLFPQTVKMLQTMIQLKRKYKSLPSQAADLWLTYQFGIRPTLSDIDSICVAIDRRLKRASGTLRFSKGVQSSFTTRDTGHIPVAIGNQGSFVRQRSCDYACRYTGAFHYSISSSANYGLGSQLGTDLKRNLPGLLWELTPYSWVVDYFTTAGSYLNDTFEVPPGSLTYLTCAKRMAYKEVTTPTNAYRANVSGSQAIGMGYTYSRAALDTLPHVALRVKSLDEIGLGGIKKILNLASVLAK